MTFSTQQQNVKRRKMEATATLPIVSGRLMVVPPSLLLQARSRTAVPAGGSLTEWEVCECPPGNKQAYIVQIARFGRKDLWLRARPAIAWRTRASSVDAAVTSDDPVKLPIKYIVAYRDRRG
ncbi:uncharacterized protein LOC111264161 isoform X2 [Varroa jacobsoni]|uniref:uncharacterized protein LOC111264161 isoform X2 n=1 Tax=Varroa jacobsoni TaxID=62625 RepID=UPI000BF4E6BE|nr:uncharacterized protein LOC111264161 isoform X2 [Varroa jacobsoni]